MTEIDFYEAILAHLVELQASVDALRPWVMAIQTYLTFAVVIGAGAAVVWFILRLIYNFLR